MLVIVKLGDSAGFVHSENGNLVITPNIQDADKFKDSALCSELLDSVRKHFPNYRFVTANCPSTIFGEKPRYVRC